MNFTNEFSHVLNQVSFGIKSFTLVDNLAIIKTLEDTELSVECTIKGFFCQGNLYETLENLLFSKSNKFTESFNMEITRKLNQIRE